MITVIVSAFPAVAIGTKCLIATSMISGSIRTRRAIPAGSRRMNPDGTVCRPLRRLHCRQTVFWCSRATGAISDSSVAPVKFFKPMRCRYARPNRPELLTDAFLSDILCRERRAVHRPIATSIFFIPWHDNCRTIPRLRSTGSIRRKELFADDYSPRFRTRRSRRVQRAWRGVPYRREGIRRQARPGHRHQRSDPRTPRMVPRHRSEEFLDRYKPAPRPDWNAAYGLDRR